MSDVTLLAIESSCDETAAAIVVNGRKVLSNVISSQIDIHKLYGGVVPEIASRKHIEQINQVIEQAFVDAEKTLDDVDGICVTYGPGLVGALLVGVGAAKAISYASGKPLIGVHHIEGHISANYICHPELEPPFLCLVVSGGHSHLVLVNDYGKYEIIGRTRDDAAGEAFDKVARSIGLGYPGGPKIDALAPSGNKDAIAASFQEAVVDVLVQHTMLAAKNYNISKIAMAGGVASNKGLRAKMRAECEKRGYSLYYPEPVFCTDNAAMIGAAGYYEYRNGVRSGLDLNAVPGLKLGER